MRAGSQQGHACEVSSYCMLGMDPCSSRQSVWDCLADKMCQFYAWGTSLGSGQCRMREDADPCSGLSLPQCGVNPLCRRADM